MTYRKKLIEVSLPLEAINREAAREKSIRHGHPSTLHLWWARRPLAACRAVLFASLVDDPSEYMPDEESARVERERLFRLIEKLVKWENSNNEDVLDEARLEIARSVARTLNVAPPVGREAVREFLAAKAPPLLDPFAGGGSIPLEAQRLGLRAYASDLNPVAVLINKALIEIPPKFANMPPVHPVDSEQSSVDSGKKGRGKKKVGQGELWQREWKGAQGLAEDVRYYGKWMRDEAFKRIGHLYPPVTITEEMLAERPDLKEQGLKPGDQLTVIAWLWARTVKCPNPACGIQMPLVRSFAISTRKGNEHYIEPSIVSENKQKFVQFTVKKGKDAPPGTVIRTGARCILCNTPVSFDVVRAEAQAGRMSAKLMGIVAEGDSKRIYLSPNDAHEQVALTSSPDQIPETDLPEKALGFRVQLYGMRKHSQLFSQRQLTILSTLSSLLEELPPIERNNSVEYKQAIKTYLSFSIDRLADKSSTLSWWLASAEKMAPTFTRHALAMVWDYAEMNPFSTQTSNFSASIEWVSKVIDYLPRDVAQGKAVQLDARNIRNEFSSIIVSTDPPYYDNIGYADLSDFFYTWLRLSLKNEYPNLLGTMLVPKQTELIATPYRFDNDKEKAQKYFEEGLYSVFDEVRKTIVNEYPITVYYAFKQSETEREENDDGDETQSEINASTGWETMLEGLLKANFLITGTWPMRTERGGRMISVGTNALASSIVLVCRPRPQNAPSCSRREFLAALKKELAPALRELQQGSIAPVDLAQAAIGPGMAVFSRYSAVLDADGSPMSVRTALALINQALDEYLAEQEGEYDADTRWALAWFEQFGHNEAPFGVAETLSKAKNTSVNGLAEAGILEARGGKVRLLRRDELSPSPRGRGARGEGSEVWDPLHDKRPTAWEAVQHLIHALESQGEASAAELLTRLGAFAAPARDLAYRLYTVCERKGWAQDALGYNMLVVAWPRLKELAAKQKTKQENLL